MTVNSQPITYNSVNDSLVYVVYDSNSIDPSKEDYRYVAELYIDAVKVHTCKTYPEPINSFGEFDMGEVIRQYCTLTLKDETTKGEFYLKNVQMKFKEEYNGTIGSVVVSSSTAQLYNYYTGRSSNRVEIEPYAKRIITNRPFIKIPENCTTFYIPFFGVSNDAIAVYLDISSGSFTVTPTTTDANCQNLNIAQLNIAVDDTLTINSTIGQDLKVYVQCEGNYDNYVLHFLNKWGGYESVLFNKVSRKIYDVERKNFQQRAYEVDASGVVSYSANNIMHRQKKTFGSRFNEKLKIQTDNLTNDEYQWLWQLVLSTDIYVQKVGEDTIYPCEIIESNYEFKDVIVDGITNLALTVEFGTTYKTQFN